MEKRVRNSKEVTAHHNERVETGEIRSLYRAFFSSFLATSDRSSWEKNHFFRGLIFQSNCFDEKDRNCFVAMNFYCTKNSVLMIYGDEKARPLQTKDRRSLKFRGTY